LNQFLNYGSRLLRDNPESTSLLVKKELKYCAII
jgi:hypothetical protein